jgi:large subunit ribosomal protein L18
MKKELIKNQLKSSRRKRVRAKVIGTANRPRLNVFRSLKHLRAQIIDDNAGKTLVSASDTELKLKKGTKVDKAQEVGKLIAKKAQEKGISQVVFDRASYKYHGRVKALADAAREAGLKF